MAQPSAGVQRFGVIRGVAKPARGAVHHSAPSRGENPKGIVAVNLVDGGGGPEQFQVVVGKAFQTFATYGSEDDPVTIQLRQVAISLVLSLCLDFNVRNRLS